MSRNSRVLVALMVVAAFAAGAVASAATGWKVFATAVDSGKYGSYASANASVQNPNGLALKALGTVKGTPEISWNINCEGVAQGRLGAVIAVDVSHAAKCTLYGNAMSSESGTLKVQLLRR